METEISEPSFLDAVKLLASSGGIDIGPRCFAHQRYPAVARVYVGPNGNVHWLPVCRDCAANHRRAGHELKPL